jgi:uncharacterized protein (TIGR03118 family)
MSVFLSSIRTPVLFLATVSFAAADNSYVQHNLVSDVPGMADRTETRLVNAWGIDRGPTSPWWVNAAGTGLSFLFDAAGMPFPAAAPLVVTIPPPGGGPSLPTGIVFNGTMDFQLAMGKPAIFLFASIRGTISGWNPGVNPTTAIIKVPNAGAAVYTGLTIGRMNNANFIYAANFQTHNVDVFDTTFTAVPQSATAFHDPQIPSNYAPFNVANIGGNIAVTFAIPDPVTHEQKAPGLGYVDIFSPSGVLLKRLEHGKWMNAPWAVTMAPSNFGKASNHLLVGQFGSGQIATFESSGEFSGLLRGPKGQPVTIDGLWGLRFGNGSIAGPMNVLYFAAGPVDETHGLFGTLTSTKENDNNDNEDNDGHDGQDHGDDHGNNR